jgi:hypothetical protein
MTDSESTKARLFVLSPLRSVRAPYNNHCQGIAAAAPQVDLLKMDYQWKRKLESSLLVTKQNEPIAGAMRWRAALANGRGGFCGGNLARKSINSESQ